MKYNFSWQRDASYVWLTTESFTVRGVVHLFESLFPDKTCTVFPMDNWTRCHMGKRVVELQNVFVALHPRVRAEMSVQTDLCNCVSLTHTEFCALLDDGQIQATINPLFYLTISLINKQQGKR